MQVGNALVFATTASHNISAISYRQTKLGSESKQLHGPVPPMMLGILGEMRLSTTYHVTRMDGLESRRRSLMIVERCMVVPVHQSYARSY